MARRRIRLGDKLRELLTHVQALPPEAATPHSHYVHSVIDIWDMYEAIEENRKTLHDSPAVTRQYLFRLRAMLLVTLVESFERYLKEVAAACIDLVAPFILDDRFDVFRVQGSAFASHFGTDSLGHALCETSTWLDTASINNRFRCLLAEPFEEGKFILFASGRKDEIADRERHDTLELVWQLRHTVVHNVGVITQSDAVAFRLMVKREVHSPRLLVPTREDLRYLKRFLDETAKTCNEKVGKRLAEVLTTIHGDDPTLFVPQAMADRVANIFGFVLVVAGATGVLPPPRDLLTGPTTPTVPA
jgi:hypothetical protein